jgi:hypothetical protein
MITTRRTDVAYHLPRTPRHLSTGAGAVAHRGVCQKAGACYDRSPAWTADAIQSTPPVLFIFQLPPGRGGGSSLNVKRETTMSSATANTARMIAKLLVERPTPHQEIPQLIDAVHRTLAKLEGCDEATATEAATPTATSGDAQDVPAPKRRGRRPRTTTTAAVVSSEDRPPSPPAPTLLRRAEVQAPVEVAPLQPPPARDRMTRGVVRWFDPQSRRGALRLQGVSGDLPFEPTTLEKANISRLFKGQEVEAELGGSSDAPTLIGFRLLAAGQAAHVNPGLVRARQQKPVMVELKREALRRAAARDAAEALLPDRRD